jgi:hemerythrin
MGQLKWSERFEIDQKELDCEHQTWVQIANRILAADTGDKQSIIQALQELGAYTRKHFANEERLLEQLSYDRLHIQRLKHQVILAEMRYTVENMPKLDDLHEALSRLIHEWVGGHILGEDRLIKRYL